MDPNQDIRSAIARVKHTSTRSGRTASGRFSMEGTRAVERALRAKVPLELVLVAEGLSEAPSEREAQLLDALRDQGIKRQVIPDADMLALTEGRDYGQVIGVAPLPVATPLPSEGLFVVAVDIADPGNLGGMIRTSLAGGAAGLVCMGSSDPWHPKAVRTSMGSIFKLPIFIRDDETLTTFEGAKLATSTAPDATPLPQVRLTTPATFVFMGSEAFGLSDDMLAQMNEQVRIPMTEGVDSYSVNVATGIVLYALLHGGDAGK